MKINKFIQENLKVTYPAEEYSSLVHQMATSRLHALFAMMDSRYQYRLDIVFILNQRK